MVTQNSTNAPTTNASVVAGTGTGYIAVPYSATNSINTIASRDANGNIGSNNFAFAQTLVTAAGGTTSLTAASARVQQLRGAASQTFSLPDATTLVAGWTFEFNNNATGTLTVQTHTTPNLVCTIPAGGYGRVSASTVSTTDGTWDSHFLMPTNASYGTAGLTVTGTISSTTLSNNEIVATNGAATLVSVSNSTAGYVLTSNGASPAPTFQPITGGGLVWTVVTGATQALATNHGYISNAASGGVTYTLPVTAAVGDIIQVTGLSGGSGWTIDQNVSQSIQIAAKTTTVGVGGSLASTSNTDSVYLVCAVANTTFIASFFTGNITVT